MTRNRQRASAPVPEQRQGSTWVLDLDGVVWLTGEPIRGAGPAVERLRRSGVRVLFATNNSSPTTAEVVARLERCGVGTTADDVVNSAQAAATLVDPGSSVLTLADDGVAEALTARGVRVVDDGPADAVIVGWTRRFDFDRLARATTAVLDGARLIGTNADPTLPTPAGPLPGAGSLLAAVSTATGVEPQVAGKPHQPLAQLITDRVGEVAVVVGDRTTTDGLLARRLRAPFALVLSGVTRPEAPLPDPLPDFLADDLAALVPDGSS
ncbi:MAG: HAD-IIA family hydrolase [Acidimicrobiales bacterium]